MCTSQSRSHSIVSRSRGYPGADTAGKIQNSTVSMIPFKVLALSMAAETNIIYKLFLRY